MIFDLNLKYKNLKSKIYMIFAVYIRFYPQGAHGVNSSLRNALSVRSFERFENNSCVLCDKIINKPSRKPCP
jgi:hypothetical protein